MRICICTTPIRPVPTTWPPLGSMAIIQALRQTGADVEFYNIDCFRPSREAVEAYFAAKQFDMVGISAVVSTAYAYTKDLTHMLRRVSPRTTIIVGGNLAASAEILLRKCHVDFCVAGDGELIVQDLVRALHEAPGDYDRLRATKGICFLDEQDRFVFTGFGQRPTADMLESPDYSILEQEGSLDQYLPKVLDSRFSSYPSALQPGERAATVITTKGCVARCTFCHRWEKGFRALPVDNVADTVRGLMDRYKVRYLDIGDENFGSNRELAWQLANRFGELGIKWRTAGVRTRTVDREVLTHWKANGCISVIYGIESGSQTILDVMEKNTTVQKNIDGLRFAYETGLLTVIQLVLGMPGETDQTIYETTEFVKKVSGYLFLGDMLPSALMSINYAQALPGTPLYEWARERGYIGKTVDDEEQYLLRISDTDAYQTDHFINYTGLPLLKVLMWRFRMLAEVDADYIQRTAGTKLSVVQVAAHYLIGFFRMVEKRYRVRRWLPGMAPRQSRTAMAEAAPSIAEIRPTIAENEYASAEESRSRIAAEAKSGYFNIQSGSGFAPLLLNPWTRRVAYPLLAVGVAIVQGDSLTHAVKLLAGHVWWSLSRPFRSSPDLPDKSLRKLVTVQPSAAHGNDVMMVPLRHGR